MSARRIKLIWSGQARPDLTWRWGLWASFTRERRRRDGIVISGRGLLAWLGALGFVGYVSLATAWFVWLERRPYNYVTWTDAVLAPLRWDEIKRRRGEAFIAEGMDDFRNQRWSEGAMKIRVGLQRQPDARTARRQLAGFLLAIRERERAVRLLQDGFVSGYPGRDYVEDFLRLLEGGQDFGAARTMLDEALAGSGEAVERDRRWLEEQRARIALKSGDHTAAIAWARTQPRTDTAALEFEVIALLESGRAEEANAVIDQWRKAGGDAGLAARLQIRTARERGDLVQLESAWETLRQLTPTSPQTYVYGVVQRALAGSERTETALRDYLFRFGALPANLSMVAAPLAEIGRGDLLAWVEAAAKEQGLEVPELNVQRIRVLMTYRRWGEAAALWDALPREMATVPNFELWREGTGLVLAVATHQGEAPAQAMAEFIRRNRLGLGTYEDLLDILEAAERWAVAADVLAMAERDFGPHVGRLRSARESIEAGRARLAAAERLAAEAREAERTAAAAATATASASVANAREAVTSSLLAGVGDEREFFARVDGLLTEGDAAGAWQVIKATRQMRPAWLGARRSEVLQRELQVHFDREDNVAFSAAARQLLDGTNARGLELMRWVERFEAAGRLDAANLLVKEVTRDLPGFPPAERKLAQWAATAEPTAVAGP